MAEPTAFIRAAPGWGMEFIQPGKARFRIWAPQAERLSLRLGDRQVAMDRDDAGWFEVMAAGVAAGERYGFVLADGRPVPDPASRAQDGDVHAPSLVVDPASYRWRIGGWRGRPWREAVIYELHVGTFTPEGTFRAATARLGHLARLGVTAVELMPVGQFAGSRGWGYDGVLPYAPHRAYGTPDDLKQFVDEAHALGLMVLLDVVYNHFGPDGNYLPLYAAEFFDPGRRTPWGAAIAIERAPVRQFFIDNALYWLSQFRFDGLRLDAVDQIGDTSDAGLLAELARRVRAELPGRHLHLTTEDNRNVTRLHERLEGRTVLYTAEWNDDFHNAAHVLLTGETDGYYEDFGDAALAQLGRCLAEGFAFQGEPSRHAGGEPRGEPSAHLPTTAFVDFLQNHDQTGNRAFGERLSLLADERAVLALSAILLLSPHVPLVFMGEEWAETRPFLFFTDFSGRLADDVRNGRREEFARFPEFNDEETRKAIPDPNAPETFQASKLDWSALERPASRRYLDATSALLALRRDHVVPLLDDAAATPGRVLYAEAGVLAVDWSLAGGLLQLRANLGDRERTVPGHQGTPIYRGPGDQGDQEARFPPWHVTVAFSR